ncbi:MAG: manganese efflux pump [Lachnospiraceae bacterium]|nr:manganese efflux pump [Lachnospiraceae bacterium]
MSIVDLFLIAVGLSMDAFAVAVCKGLSVQRASLKQSLIVGLYFGGFQAGMPLIGYLIGSNFADYIEKFDHWIAFVLLGSIGINMIRESREEGEELNASFGPKAMLPMAVATSIDALAVGVSFAFMKVQIGWAVSFIGVITFTLSAIGVKIGNLFGAKYKSKAELFGGVVLIALGIKILVEHLLG